MKLTSSLLHCVFRSGRKVNCESLVCNLCSYFEGKCCGSVMSYWTVAHQAPLSLEFYRQEYWSGLPFPSPGDLSNPRIGSRSPTLQMDSLLSEPTGKSKNTGVSSLSLLQWLFPTQESIWGLLHCRQILYHLSHQESPII